VTGIVALDARADLYSVGVLLFYAITGRLPFDGANDFEIMVAQVSAPPPRPASLNPAIAPELERIILTALAKKPEQRFPSATAFRSALVSLTGAMTIIAETVSPPPETAQLQLPATTAPDALNRILLVSGILCFLVALLVVVLVAVHR